MNKQKEFPDNLEAKLARHERILQLYQSGDLLEIFQLGGLEDEWESYRDTEGRLWDINLHFDGSKYITTLYETAKNESDAYITISNNFINIPTEVE